MYAPKAPYFFLRVETNIVPLLSPGIVCDVHGYDTECSNQVKEEQMSMISASGTSGLYN